MESYVHTDQMTTTMTKNDILHKMELNACWRTKTFSIALSFTDTALLFCVAYFAQNFTLFEANLHLVFCSLPTVFNTLAHKEYIANAVYK